MKFPVNFLVECPVFFSYPSLQTHFFHQYCSVDDMDAGTMHIILSPKRPYQCSPVLSHVP